MGFDIAWIKELGLDTQSGVGFTGSTEKYISAVQRFYGNYQKNKSKVEEYFNNKDFEKFMITVHALKSNAKMIGATELSKGFETLENASRNKDIQIIETQTGVVLDAYEDLMTKLKPIEKLGDVRAVDEISAETALKTADELIEALDDFDDELAKKLAQKLSGYPFRITQRDRLKEAIAFINDFMYDEAAEIIKEIYSTIE